MTTKTTYDVKQWAGLLAEAVSRPGMISAGYRAFHGYSIGKELLALSQCAARKLRPGPLSTYPGWLAKGRRVRRGERALVLCMPLACKRRPGPVTEGDDDPVYTRFIYRANWFTVCQTEGEPVETPATPGWDKARALETLGITEVSFDHQDGNCLGYAKGKEIAVNPVNPMPWKTVFHELGHCLLGHTSEGGAADGGDTRRDLREVEAEAVALLCCESLGLPGADYSRGYIQVWLRGEVIPEQSARRVFHAADLILKAGRPADAG